MFTLRGSNSSGWDILNDNNEVIKHFDDFREAEIFFRNYEEGKAESSGKASLSLAKKGR